MKNAGNSPCSCGKPKKAKNCHPNGIGNVLHQVNRLTPDGYSRKFWPSILKATEKLLSSEPKTERRLILHNKISEAIGANVFIVAYDGLDMNATPDQATAANIMSNAGTARSMNEAYEMDPSMWQSVFAKTLEGLFPTNNVVVSSPEFIDDFVIIAVAARSHEHLQPRYLTATATEHANQIAREAYQTESV